MPMLVISYVLKEMSRLWLCLDLLVFHTEKSDESRDESS